MRFPRRAALMKSALEGVAATPMPQEWKANNKAILGNNVAFNRHHFCA
jgi:hypothetical protein